MRMMKGHKWELFVLQLSFIGWGILSLLTLGILGVFYVDPYRHATLAAYYENLKEESIHSGMIMEEEFLGSELIA